MGVWLRLVGAFAVNSAGQPVPTIQVGSRKARTLLALLAVERAHLVAVDRIADVLWPDAPPRRPAENVATLVSRLRAALGADIVAGGRGGYRLGDPVGTDLRDGAVLVAEAESRTSAGEPSLALAAAHRALELLGDGAVVLADEPHAAWAEPARAAHADLLRRARHTAAGSALRLGDPATAGPPAEAAVRADPLDEAATRLLMRAYDAAGEPARALAVYERVRSALADELGVDPAEATRDLHVSILRGRPGPGGHVLQAEPEPVPKAPTDLAFAGRELEVARLATAWSNAAAGRPRACSSRARPASARPGSPTRWCAGGALAPAPALAAFRTELTNMSPTVIGVTDLDAASAWRAALYDAGAGFDLQIVWRVAATAYPVVRAMASRHGLVCYDPQAGAIHHPQWMLDAPRSQLTTGDGSLWYDPDPAAIQAALDGLTRYAILSRQDLGPECYLQVGGHDGRWSLEYRDGSADRHYRCALPSPEPAREAFLGYALGTDGWQARFAWTALGLSA